MDVVGESRRLDALHQIIRAHAGGQLPQRGEIIVQAQLVGEPGNPVDPQAVAVYVEGLQVGYIPREKTGLIHGAFASEGADWLAVEATIGWGRPEVIGVRLTGIDEDLGTMRWEGSGVFPPQEGSKFATGNKWVWVLAALVVLAIIWFTVR